jgi:hypothetical protein
MFDSTQRLRGTDVDEADEILGNQLQLIDCRPEDDRLTLRIETADGNFESVAIVGVRGRRDQRRTVL